jgi:hypothetical protein
VVDSSLEISGERFLFGGMGGGGGGGTSGGEWLKALDASTLLTMAGWGRWTGIDAVAGTVFCLTRVL